MNYDFAIVYFGLTRSTKKVYETHIRHVFDILERNDLTYKTFMHTWKTMDNRQKIWGQIIDAPIDYEEYTLLRPHVYRIDSQDEYLQTVDMNQYFYKDVWDRFRHSRRGEWLPDLIRNHICALKSQKTGFEMVEESVRKGNTFKYVMFIRPDVSIKNDLPLDSIIGFDGISIPDADHNEGYNDRFAILPYNKSHIYGKRLDELAEFRKTNGRIVSEKYVKYIIHAHQLRVNLLKFHFDIVRP